MDFFEHQDVARRKSGLLVFYFALAVIIMIVLMYFVVCAITFYAGGSSYSEPTYQYNPITGENELVSQGEAYSEPQLNFWQPEVLLWVTGRASPTHQM